jgi:hypothetical protein
MLALVAPAQSKRQSRKRRRPRASAPAARRTPAATSVAQPGATAARPPAARHDDASARGAVATTLTGRTYGDPPPNLFGGVPVSEIAILAGGIAVLVGLLTAATEVLIVGIVICTLGVLEFTAREHFSGYRSHATLLAAVPAVGIGIALIALDSTSLTRDVLVPVVLAVFAVLFWVLRNRFRVARQARIARPPGP